MKTLKFRSFSSKDRQGFIFFTDGKIPPIILQDLLFQLFQPLFPDILCPQIYYFSSHDQSLSYNKMLQIEDYIYVHFLERVQIYRNNQNLYTKIIICPYQQLAKGLNFHGINLYIVSEKSYLMYKKQFYRDMMKKKIQDINIKKMRKIDKYKQYIKELSQLKDNSQILSLKYKLQQRVNDFQKRLQIIQDYQRRLVKAKDTLSSIMNSSGISLKSISDLK